LPAHTDRFLAAGLVVLAVFIVVGIGALGGGNGRGFSFEPSYDPHTFSLGVVFTAVSIAVLSFLGFDGIATRGCPRSRARPGRDAVLGGARHRRGVADRHRGRELRAAKSM
jgi:amino acid transporter